MRNVKIFKKRPRKKTPIKTQEIENVDEPAELNILSDEILRSRIRKIIDEPKPSSTWERVSTNPLVSVILGFLLTGLIGASLAYYYNKKQQELEFNRQTQQRNLEHERDIHEKELENQRAEHQRTLASEHDDRQKDLEFQRNAQQRELERERSFSDKLSKSRVQKIAEVWEKIYIYDADVDRYVGVFDEWDRQEAFIANEKKKGVGTKVLEMYKSQLKQFPQKSQEIYPLLKAQHENILELIHKNGFWLGDYSSTEILKYIEISDALTLAAFDNDPKLVKKLKKEKAKAKPNIIRIRNRLLRE